MGFLRRDGPPGLDPHDAPARARASMVRDQLRARGVRSPGVLEVMGRLAREDFVLPEDAARAYDDRPLPIGDEATISQPYIVALMTEALDPGPRDRVLEIGTGSGYQTAVLASLAAEIYTIEIVDTLAQRARRTLARLGIDNVRWRLGDGRLGWPEEAPFDGILVTAAPVRIPDELLRQLADGGRLVAPVGEREQRLTLWRRSGARLERTDLAWVRFVPLLGGQPR